jgi:hypothetical protein
MKANELARRLDGMDLGDFPSELNSTAERAGLVVVIGIDKRTVEFFGAIQDQIEIEDGGTIHLDAEGILPDPDDVSDDDRAAYYDRKRLSFLIDAEWGMHGFPWSFTTAIPHHRFVVLGHDGGRYCRSIVFDKAMLGTGGAA